MSLRRVALAVVAFAIIALIESGNAEDQPELRKNEPSKIITLLNSAGSLTPDPKAMKRDVTFENPRVMQPYHIVQASEQRPILVPGPPAPRKGSNCIRAFLINQLRETNDNINRLLECLKKNDAQICSKAPIQLCNEQPQQPPQRCEQEINQLIVDYTTDRPYMDMDMGVEATTTLQDIRFCNEYIKEESEEVDTNRYSSVTRPLPSPCYDVVPPETTPKPRKRCSKAPPAATTTKRPCRITTTRRPATKKPCRKMYSGECKCMFCVEDGTCAGSFD